ncbi:MAG TPA: fatty acid desaturase [Kofleriaceae bacterium]|jgi:fatty acid desaturase|nr:fatty acid desaturase [Kofleriaceae bacterium]
MELIPVAAYARQVRPLLPADAFAPARSRALWIPLHYAIIAVLSWALASGHVPWPAWPVVSLVIGCCMAGVTFVAHEALHGGVVRGRATIRLIGWLGFLPFCISPQLWIGWHNRVHHNHCGQPGVDPDMYPTLTEYRATRGAQIMADHFGLGRRSLTGVCSLLFGLTGQSVQVMFRARRVGILPRHLHRRAIIETVMAVAVWAAVASLVGGVAFIFIYVLPLIVANTIVMTFIVTNHNLSPLSPVNDPLVNSLSVTLPRVVEWLTLDFGFHVEHHLFPSMSHRQGRIVREVLRAQFPERYQSLPLGAAIRRLHRTARVYRDNTTLIDPHTGETWQTLLPASRAAT